MKSTEIRQVFLDFAAARQHAIIPSAPVVPEHDPTTLFNIAGMQPLVPYLLGETHPAGKRLANIQKCIRTIDLDEVGDDSHNTFMEMLGWWSLGDYFKEETIAMSWELFTKVLKMPTDKLAVTVFEGDANAERDEESAELWKAQGVPKERIFYRSIEDNWWGPAGQTGPCGPSTEIFYWVGAGEPSSDIDNENWLELGNNVLMHYEKTAEGKFEPLAQRNVDTGLGFERIVGVLQGASNVYETDLYLPLLTKLKELSTNPDTRAERIIVDHIKAATFMIADGVRPSNTERGYVLRRLIRRAIRQGKVLGTESEFTEQIARVVIKEFGTHYPELRREARVIADELEKEEGKFSKTINQGLKILKKKFIGGWTVSPWSSEPHTPRSARDSLSGEEAFHLFETYGFPYELTLEVAKENKLEIDPNISKNFEKAHKAHQAKSRAGAEQKFAGGLADHSDKVVRQHTATHLLLAALRNVLGEDIKQRGSNITAERLRFDFSHPEKLTEEQLNQVEALVNEWIKEDLPVTRQEMPREEAERIGAQMEFGHKYPDIVSVYFVGDPASAHSKEFCGGPHVEHTGEIGNFKIKKQESVGAGVRRIKAVIE